MIQSVFVITKYQNSIATFLIRDNKLTRLNICNPENDVLNNIYIGKVKKIASNINSAFVEYNSGQLCYLSLNDNKQFYLTETGSVSDTIKEGDELLVQIVKEALQTKDAVADSTPSISGTYCVVSYPFDRKGKLYFSQKLSKETVSKLKEQLNKEYPYDVIIRTKAGSALDFDLIIREIDSLCLKMEEIMEHAKTRTCFSNMYQSVPEYLNMIFSTESNEYDKIITDIPRVYDTLYHFMQENHKEEITKLNLYEDEYSLTNLYLLESKMDELLKKKVWLKSGGNIVIEVTEALTVIDVNTSKSSSNKNKEQTILNTNIEAAIELTRQIILRNLSGIIIIDFINMQSNENKENLIQVLKNQLKKDPIKCNFIDITPLGLVEITRKKEKKTLFEQLNFS